MNIRAPGVSSIPPLGSTAHSCTDPSRTPAARPRTSDHSTEPFPAPVAPAISTCVPSSRSAHGSGAEPSGLSATPTTTRDGSARSGTGTAGCTGARQSRAAEVQPDPARPVDPHPARRRAERVRERVRGPFEVLRGLPGEQIHQHRVTPPGRPDPAQSRQPLAVPERVRQTGQHHGRLPVPGVHPATAPPGTDPAPDVPLEPVRPAASSHRQPGADAEQDAADRWRPPAAHRPGHDDHRTGQHRVPQ